MSIYLGSNKLNKIYLGGISINKIMLGITQVFGGRGAAPVEWTPQDMFGPTDNGAWIDFYDDMDTKLAFRRNQLLWSEDLTNEVWQKANTTVTANALGNMDKLVVTGASGAFKIATQAKVVMIGETYSIDAKAGELEYVAISRNNSGGYWFGYVFNLTDGTIGPVHGIGGTDDMTPIIEDIGDGVYRCSVRWNSFAGAVGDNLSVSIIPSIDDNPIFGGTRNSAGDGVSGVYVNRVQQGVETAYQKITDFNTEFLAEFPDHALFQDSAGTTAVTAVEQSIGLVLDKSKGLALGAELVDTANLATTWTPSAGFTFVQNGDSVEIIPSGGGVATLPLNETGGLTSNLTLDKNYLVTFDCKIAAGSGIVYIYAGGSSIGPPAVANTDFARYQVVITSAYDVAWASLNFSQLVAGETVTIKNISVRELPGNHLVQTSQPKRPLLSARKNLVKNSTNFTTDWILSSGATLTSGRPDPDGGNTAQLIDVTATGAGFRSDTCFWPAVACVNSLWLRSDTPGTVFMQSNTGVKFNGTVNVTPEWTKFSINSLSDISDAQWWIGREGFQTCPTFEIWHPQAEKGTVATNYQSSTSNTDYDTVGFPHYAKFDGIDDVLQGIGSSSELWNDTFMIIGQTFLSGAEICTVSTNTANASTVAAKFNQVGVTAGNGAAAGSGTIYSANIPTIIGAVVNTASDISQARKDGADFGAPMITGGSNFGTFRALTIGANPNTTGNFAATEINQWVVLGRLPTAQEITETETFVANKMEVTFT